MIKSLMDMSRFTRGHNQFPEILMLFMLEMKARSGTGARLLAGVLPVPAKRTVDMYNNSGAGVAGHCVMFGVQTYLAREVSEYEQGHFHINSCLFSRCMHWTTSCPYIQLYLQSIMQAAVDDGLEGDELLAVRAGVENVHVCFDGCKIPGVCIRALLQLVLADQVPKVPVCIVHYLCSVMLLQGKTKSNRSGHSQGFSESMFSRHNAALEGAKQREQDPADKDYDGITKRELLEFAVNQGLAGNDLMIWCASSVKKYKGRGVEVIIRAESKT